MLLHPRRQVIWTGFFYSITDSCVALDGYRKKKRGAVFFHFFFYLRRMALETRDELRFYCVELMRYRREFRTRHPRSIFLLDHLLRGDGCVNKKFFFFFCECGIKIKSFHFYFLHILYLMFVGINKICTKILL